MLRTGQRLSVPSVRRMGLCLKLPKQMRSRVPDWFLESDASLSPQAVQGCIRKGQSHGLSPFFAAFGALSALLLSRRRLATLRP